MKNDFIEKEWFTYCIFKMHPIKNQNKVSVPRFLNRFKKYGSMDRRFGSGRPQTATSEGNEEKKIPGLICHL